MIVHEFLRWIETAPSGLRAEAAHALARAFLYSDLDEETRARGAARLAGRGLVGVDVAAGSEEGLDGDPLAADAAHEPGLGGHGGGDLEGQVARRRGGLARAIPDEGEGRHGEERQREEEREAEGAAPALAHRSPSQAAQRP